MKPDVVTVILAVLVAGGQAFSIFTSLMVRNAVLKMERRVLDEVDRKYKRQDVCGAEMKALSGHRRPA
jgi:hypothetical protein